MKEYIFTFGYGQTPGIGNYTVIEAEDESKAREIMVSRIGLSWSFTYPSREAAGVDRWKLKKVEWTGKEFIRC